MKKLLYCIFGEWNGIQNLLAFPVLVFLFDQTGFTKWIIGLLSVQRYFLPVFFYFVFLFFLMFILIKATTQWLVCQPDKSNLPKTRLGRDLLIPLTINLHMGLLIIMFTLMVVFMLKSGFAFIYRINLPFFTAFLITVRLSLIFCIVYVYALLDVIVPLMRKGHSFNCARQYFYLIIAKRWKQFIVILLAQLFLIFVSVTVFEKMIGFIEELNSWGIITMTGKALVFPFAEGKTIVQTGSNVLLLCLGFLISNLLYCPFIFLFKKGFQILKLKLNG